MKPIPRYSKSVEIEFFYKKQLCFRATFPYNNKEFKITEWYKKTKEAVASAENVPVWEIKGNHNIIGTKEINSRILFEWPGGISLDMPADKDNYDYKIILHYLEGVKMACRK